MKTINKTTLAKSREYIENNCRRLVKELFIHSFERENTKGAISALRAFQNGDGGFGHGLERDFLLPDSSPMATSVAFGILTELDVPSDEPIVGKGIEYLMNTYDPDRGKWRTVPKEVNDHPHAPWWHYMEEEDGTVLDRNWGNPTAEIVGYLVRYSKLVPADLLNQLYDHTLEYLRNQPDTMEMHELYCFLRFSEHISPDDFQSVRDKLTQLVMSAVTADPEGWKQYSSQPLDFVKSPDSFLCPLLREHVEINLDYWIDSMAPEGVWLPTWSWEQYEEAWLEAARDITGGLTVERFKVLDRFHRVESQRESWT